MIVTVTTVAVMVIGLLSLGLALYGGYVSISVAEGAAGDEVKGTLGVVESRIHVQEF